MLAQKKENCKGYYTDKILEKFTEAYKEAVELVNNDNSITVRISNGNSKMGDVASVSTIPFVTCPARCKGTCGVKCYAAKIANLYTSVLKSYAINTALAIHKPDVYWNGIDTACKAVRYFRFHVSGDIINGTYFERMIETAVNNPKTEMLCFTKRYEIVNTYIRNHGGDVNCIPENLHILFSGWTNLKTVNPYDMPETNVFKEEAEIQDNWKLCGGNCFNCACRGVGCWQLKTGETVAFKMH